MREGGNAYHHVRGAFGVDKWTEYVPSLGQMTDLPSRWPECISDPKLRQHLQATKNSTCPKLSSSTRHNPIECRPSPSSTRFGWDKVRPCTNLSPLEAPGRNRPSSVLLLNPVRLLLLLVEVVSSACSSFWCAASGGALALEPPHATGDWKSHGFCPFLGCYFWVGFFSLFFFSLFLRSDFIEVCRTSLSDLRLGGNCRGGQRYSGLQIWIEIKPCPISGKMEKNEKKWKKWKKN